MVIVYTECLMKPRQTQICIHEANRGLKLGGKDVCRWTTNPTTSIPRIKVTRTDSGELAIPDQGLVTGSDFRITISPGRRFAPEQLLEGLTRI